MIILAIVFITQKRGANPADLPQFEFRYEKFIQVHVNEFLILYLRRGLPNLFGFSVYAFMCHHSLPSIITPVSYESEK